LAVSLEMGLVTPSGLVTQFNWNLANASYVLPVIVYLDPGGYIAITENEVGSPGFDIASQFVTITGYMLDCTAAPCTAIAQ
jgi:hypothetical protein